jgi:hypothetical protein
MALIVADRVQETSTTTGTGPLTLLGATTGNRAASAVCANGDTFTYYAEAIDANERPTGAWETGLGTWGTGNILTRTTIYASSNAGAAVSWAAGTKRIGLGLVSTAALGPTTIVGNISATNLSGTNTGDQSAASILTDIKTVDGTGSGLDADLLDGIHASGFVTTPIVVLASAATYNAAATSGTTIILCNTTSNSITVNLPTAVGNTAIYEIKKIAAANSMILDPASTETIDGSATITVVVENESLTLVSDNTNWKVI